MDGRGDSSFKPKPILAHPLSRPNYESKSWRMVGVNEERAGADQSVSLSQGGFSVYKVRKMGSKSMTVLQLIFNKIFY